MSYNLIHCNCGCIYAEADGHNCNKVSDAYRIEELEAKLKWVLEERDATFALMLKRLESAEAKLAKAVEALEIGMTCTEEHGGAAKFLRIARTTLEELKGQPNA